MPIFHFELFFPRNLTFLRLYFQVNLQKSHQIRFSNLEIRDFDIRREEICKRVSSTFSWSSNPSQRSCYLFSVRIRTGSQAKKRMSGSHTSVHDNGQPRRFRYPPGLLRGDPKLEPEDLCTDCDSLPGDLERFLGGTEH